MNHSKPKLVGPARAVCPVCGTTAYSRGGIHPQCAVTRADRLTPRAKVAVTAGKAVAAASRAAGRGSGSVIGGRVALKLDPDLLARLARNLDVVLVSATNGKTTTTRLIAEALRASGPVVSNALGANMPAGITSARVVDQVKRALGLRRYRQRRVDTEVRGKCRAVDNR